MPETATKFPVLTDALTHGKLKTSPTMIAILGCIADVHTTEPAIEELCVTVDGWVKARHDDEVTMDTTLGSGEDLDSNLRGVCDTLEIGGDEREAILTAVRRW